MCEFWETRRNGGKVFEKKMKKNKEKRRKRKKAKINRTIKIVIYLTINK